MVKRTVDCVIAVALLLLTSPILMIAALVIWISSPGPVLFRQVRMGRGFQPFEILKLRTMAHAEGGLAYTLGADSRITPVGRWLRWSKIDELPQLWNILRGEMSLVGPRPVVPELTAEFNFHYKLLLRVRPGLTDPASLKYSQEAQLLNRARDSFRFFKTVVTPDKIRISLEYMERATIWSDAGTLAMTAVICAFPRMQSVYGRLPDPAIETARPLMTPLERYISPPLYAQHAEARPAVVIGSSRPAVDGCVFSHELAQLEARMEATDSSGLAGDFQGTAEDRGRPSRLPWNRWQVNTSRHQSTPPEAQESVSGL